MEKLEKNRHPLNAQFICGAQPSLSVYAVATFPSFHGCPPPPDRLTGIESTKKGVTFSIMTSIHKIKS